MPAPPPRRLIVALALIVMAPAGVARGQAASAPSGSGVSASLFSGQTEHAPPPSPRPKDPRAASAPAPTSIYGLAPPPTIRDLRVVPAPAATPETPPAPPPARLGAPPTLQSGGLPIYGLARRTDTTPVCRSACAGQYYTCGAGVECVAARGTCLQQCAAPRAEWGRFGVAPQ